MNAKAETTIGIRLLGIGDAARYLGIKKQTLYQDRKIPRVYIGRRVLFDLSDLNDYIESRRTYCGTNKA